MILIDMNQITIAALMGESKGKPEYDENLIRHIILNSIRSIKQKYGQKYGDVVLCYDGAASWRRDIFPQYKGNRKKSRDKSTFDWKQLFNFLSQVREEMKTYMPYKVLHNDKAEADDIIATLAKNRNDSPILVVSSDTDFIQLQKYKNIEQYSTIMKKWIKSEDPIAFLFEHVLRGDESDGIPNYLSDSDTFVTDGKRQRTLSGKKVLDLYTKFCKNEDWMKDIESKENYERNRNLIDFDCIPAPLEQEILNMYDTAPVNNRSEMMNYFITYKMKHMMSNISEF